MNSYLDAELVKDLIGQSRGQIFTVIFRKLDGAIRKINCRTGVKKYLKSPLLHDIVATGNVRTNRITVYDLNKKAYRSFKANRVVWIKIRGFNFAAFNWDF